MQSGRFVDLTQASRVNISSYQSRPPNFSSGLQYCVTWCPISPSSSNGPHMSTKTNIKGVIKGGSRDIVRLACD